MTMHKLKASLLMLALGALSSSLQAQAPKLCQKISGTAVETILPRDSAPNDPFGRIGGTLTGNFAGVSRVSKTAILTSAPAFSSNGVFAARLPIGVSEVFVTGPGDSLTVKGTSYFTQAPATLPGETVQVSSKCPGTPCVLVVTKVSTITGGTGRWAGVTGELREIGLGNLNLPQGQGTFVSFVDGEACFAPGSIQATSNEETL